MEADLVKREGFPFKEIPAAGVHGVGLRSLPRNLAQVLAGIKASREIIKDFKPDILFFTGGYVAVPMALAGKQLESLLYVPDIEPGMALKVLSRFSDQIAVTAEESRKFFQFHPHVTVTGYPTRQDLSGWTRERALEFFTLRNDAPILLVFGGSKGARSINQAITGLLPQLLQRVQIIHLIGRLDFEEVAQAREKLPKELAGQYRIYPYLHEMGAAFAAADLAISRAGASTLGELPLFGLPAVLVPYPYAWRYQKVNAAYLVDHGAAVLVKDENLNTDLLPLLMNLLDQPERLAEMGKAASRLSVPDASERIASLLLKQAKATKMAGGELNG